MFIRIIGLITLAASLIALARSLWVMRTWVRVKGRGVRHREEKTSEPTERNEFVLVEFQDSEGRTLRSECSWIFKRPFEQDGVVPIRYNPDDPSEIRVVWWIKDWAALLGVAMIGFWLIFLG